MAAISKQKKCSTPNEQQHVFYYSKVFHPSFYCFLLFRFNQHYIYHFVTQNYRRNLSHIGYALPQVEHWHWRLHGAIQDAVYNLLLDGYTELTGLKISPATGQMLFLLIELTKCLDEHLDSQLGQRVDASLSLHEVLTFPPLQEQLATFHRYLDQFGRAEPILTYLKTRFTEQYEAHIQALKAARRSLAFDDILAVAHVDNGGWLRAVIEVVRLFNGHEIEGNLLDDYYFLGMAGKFTDDMVDLLWDMKQGYLNLLHSLLLQDPAEFAAFELAVQQRKRLKFSWWKRYCPMTYTRYFTQIACYYNQIRSSQLRMVYDLMMFLPTFGRNIDPTR